MSDGRAKRAAIAAVTKAACCSAQPCGTVNQCICKATALAAIRAYKKVLAEPVDNR